MPVAQGCRQYPIVAHLSVSAWSEASGITKTYMVPVVQKQVAEINIVVRSGGAVDQYTTKQSIPRLHVEMRVVPGGSILGSTPLIGETVSGSDWTLSYTGNAIVVVRIVLSDAMEMNRSSVVLKCIGYMHDLMNRLVVAFCFCRRSQEVAYRPSRPSQR